MKIRNKVWFISIITAVGLTACQMGKPLDNLTDNETSDEEKQVVLVNLDFKNYEFAEELCEAADVAIVGEVTESHQEIVNIGMNGDDTSYPYTIYTFCVKQAIKGAVNNGDSFSIKVLGGTLNEQEYITSEQVSLEIGKSYFIAAETYENTYASPLNYTQGIIEYSSEDESVLINGEVYPIDKLAEYSTIK